MRKVLQHTSVCEGWMNLLRARKSYSRIFPPHAVLGGQLLLYNANFGLKLLEAARKKVGAATRNK